MKSAGNGKERLEVEKINMEEFCEWKARTLFITNGV